MAIYKMTISELWTYAVEAESEEEAYDKVHNEDEFISRRLTDSYTESIEEVQDDKGAE